MSSYLNFFLVPKRKEGQEEQKPMHLISYNRSSNIYTTFYEELNPPFNGDGNQFRELTKEDMRQVIQASKEHLKRTEDNFNKRIQAYRTLYDKIGDEVIQDYVETLSYIEELKENIAALETISLLVNDIKYSDFEKILINID